MSNESKNLFGHTSSFSFPVTLISFPGEELFPREEIVSESSWPNETLIKFSDFFLSLSCSHQTEPP